MCLLFNICQLSSCFIIDIEPSPIVEVSSIHYFFHQITAFDGRQWIAGDVSVIVYLFCYCVFVQPLRTSTWKKDTVLHYFVGDKIWLLWFSIDKKLSMPTCFTQCILFCFFTCHGPMVWYKTRPSVQSNVYCSVQDDLYNKVCEVFTDLLVKKNPIDWSFISTEKIFRAMQVLLV